MKAFKLWFLVLLLAGLAVAQSEKKPSAMQPAIIPAFDANAIDRSVDPCVDFFHYACGNWIKNNPVPADRARWGRFDELQEHNLVVLHNILERLSDPQVQRSALEQKVGDYYGSCMDEAAIEARGTRPLEPEMKRIAAIKKRQQLIEEIARLHHQGIGGVFAFYPIQDFNNSEQTIANVDQGGLGMPDRDYYLKDDPRSVEIRNEYVKHVQKMFELLGDKPQAAAAEAKTVMVIETGLAKASMDRTLRRDPKNRNHHMTSAELEKLAPAFDFPRYFASAGAPKFSDLNVTNPEFFKQVNEQLNAAPLAEWKTYLRWHLVHETAAMLPKALVDEDFRFNKQVLTGQKEIRARWKRCASFTDSDLGEALGQSYVELTFGSEGKQRTLRLVDALETALKEDIQQLPWMTDATRQQAQVKLAAIRNKIGYPDKWRDYSKLDVVRGDALGNSLRANEFEENRQMAKIGRPVDKLEWFMTPPTVNAYYSPNRNEIVFPAGILQPPFYSNQADDAVNFGGIGAVIGHELTHGFDDQGRKYDPKGNLRDWWTAEDGKAFEERAGCIADEYGQFTAVGDVKLNGRLTLGENTADNGGVRIAYMALKNTLEGKDAPKIDGYTPEQRFFLSYGQIWCQNVTPEEARHRAITDPHSPGQWRVNGVVQNNPDFTKAFSCKSGQPMVRANACRVW